jgi:hypothetical protein
MRKIARRLIVETDGEASAVSGTRSEFPATDRMRPQLARLLGHGGIRALLGRALVLAIREAPWLSAASVTTNGDLEGFQSLKAEIDPPVLLEGRVILLAQLLGLLVTFVGPTLTCALVREAWPGLAFDDRDFEMEPRK